MENDDSRFGPAFTEGEFIKQNPEQAAKKHKQLLAEIEQTRKHERLFMEIVQDKEIQDLMARVIGRVGYIWGDKFCPSSGPDHVKREEAFIKFLTEELTFEPEAELTGDEPIYQTIIDYAKFLKHV